MGLADVADKAIQVGHGSRKTGRITALARRTAVPAGIPGKDGQVAEIERLDDVLHSARVFVPPVQNGAGPAVRDDYADRQAIDAYDAFQNMVGEGREYSWEALIRVGCTAVLSALIGAGKTTLVKLLVGLYRPKTGHIHYNGIPEDEVDIDSLRGRIGFVTPPPAGAVVIIPVKGAPSVVVRSTVRQMHSPFRLGSWQVRRCDR